MRVTWFLFEEAQRRGVEALVLTYPEDIVDASMNDLGGLAAMGRLWSARSAFLEGSKFEPARKMTCASTSTRPGPIRRSCVPTLDDGRVQSAGRVSSGHQ